MNRMREWLARAANELGLRITVAFEAELPDGRIVESQALFLDLGGDKGTLVFAFQQDVDKAVRKALKEQGFALSTFSEPYADEQFDIQSYAAMFREWGWTGRLGEKPPFMR